MSASFTWQSVSIAGAGRLPVLARRRRCRALPLALVALLCAAALGAAESAATPAAAAAAFAAQDWAGAARLYGELRAADPRDPTATLRLAVAWSHVGRAVDALPLFERAAELGAPAPQVAFRKAGALAALGRREAAFGELRRAATAGFAQLQLLRGDELLGAATRSGGSSRPRSTATCAPASTTPSTASSTSGSAPGTCGRTARPRRSRRPRT
jgi:tetratricopeptide (TPR) repeat protein